MYRDPDSERQAAAEQQLAAEETLEADAAAGRALRVRREAGIDRRMVGARPGGRLELGVIIGSSVVAYATATAAGLLAPLGIAIGAGTAVVAGAGFGLARRIRMRRDTACFANQKFPVLGAEHVLASRRVVIGITSIITVESNEPVDRQLVVDLVGHLDALDPSVTVDGTRIVIDAMVAPSPRSVRRFVRGVIEQVAADLHAARGVRSLQFLATTAARDQPYDMYR